MESAPKFTPPSMVYKTTKDNAPRSGIEKDLAVAISSLVNPSCPSGESGTAPEVPYTVSDLEASIDDGSLESFKGGVSLAKLLVDPATSSTELVVPVSAFLHTLEHGLTATEAFCQLLEKRLKDNDSYLEALSDAIHKSTTGPTLPHDETWEIDFSQLLNTVVEIDVWNADGKCSIGAMPNPKPRSGSSSPGGDNGFYEGLFFRYPAAEVFANIRRLHKIATAAVHNKFSHVCDIVEFSGEDEERVFVKNLTPDESNILLNLIGVKRYLNYLLMYLIDTYRQSAASWDAIVSRVKNECLNGIGRRCSPMDAVQLLGKLEIHPQIEV